MASQRGLTLGTAGHIDHGKTALVQALTGKDTDRLAEEKRRGISIELGFAELRLPDGRALGVIDVPGHERLVKTMVAGACGIDLYLLAVAADDGVMPQTREHLAVLRALGVDRGVIALTKCDLVDPGHRSRVLRSLCDLGLDVAVVAVSVRDGSGLDELRAALSQVATAAGRGRDAHAPQGPGPPSPGPPSFLHVDRAFTLRGIGTVVTGTMQGGAVCRGDRVDVLPAGVGARVRSLHVHDQAVGRAHPGQRTALNLAGIRRSDVAPGDLVASPGSGVRPSYRLDVELALEPHTGDLDRKRVQIHHGTRDAPARVIYLDAGRRFAQLRLESPLLARSQDRVVIRRLAPPDTLGGARVIDPAPRRHSSGDAADRLALICEGSPSELLVAALRDGPVPIDTSRWTGHELLGVALRHHSREAWEAAMATLADEDRIVSADGLLRNSLPPRRASARRTADRPVSEISTQLDELDIKVYELIRADGSSPRSADALAGALGTERERAVAALGRLARAGRVKRLRSGVYYPGPELERLCQRVVEVAERRGGSVSLAEVRDELGTSRKYAQALLEHLDAAKVMIRRGERHHLRRMRPRGARSQMGRQESGGSTGLQSQ